jgi:hypothetical protein
VENYECRRKVYLPYEIAERHLFGRDDCGKWMPYMSGRRAICVATKAEAARSFAVLLDSGDPEAAEAARESQERLREFAGDWPTSQE